MLCLKYLGLDLMLDKLVLAAIYFAQPDNVMIFFEKHLSLIFWKNSIWILSILQLNLP